MGNIKELTGTSFTFNPYVGIRVNDIAAAEKFYGDVLKLTLVSKKEKYLTYTTGNFQFFVAEDNSHPPVLSFTVKNLNEAKQYLINNGCEIVEGDDNYAWFKDSNGTVFDIVAE